MLTFNGNATTALVNSALQQITYRNTNGTPPASVQIDFTFNDGNAGAQGSGGALNATGAITVSITSTNIVPTLDLDANDSSGATGNDYAFTFTEGDAATAIADSDTDLVDADSVTFAYVKLSVSGVLDGNSETLVLDGDTFALGTAVAGQDTTGGNYRVVMATGAGTATITITKQGGGTFTEAETENLIEAVQYQHTDTSTPTDGNRLIDVLVNDGTSDSAAARTTINVNPVNDQPAFSGLDNTPTFIEGGTPVVLDSNATIADPELDAIDNYNGATLTLVRNGGANAEDLFDGGGTLNTLSQGGNLVVGGTTIGTVTTNSGGTLVLSFNGNATTALVNSALQQITYANSSGTPPATVQIDFTIDDGNAGAQGSGGALNGTGSITVSITSLNTPPVAVADGFTVNEGSTNNLNLAGNDSDLDDGLDLTSITIVAGPTNGTIDSINTDGTVEYTHNGSETLSDSFTYTIKDVAGNTSNTVTVSLIITPQNDAPIITSNGGGASANVSVITGTTAVTDVDATDAEGSPVTYSIIGGADAARFTIDPTTGVLRFITAPNLGTPSDVGGNNVYDVIVQAWDGTDTDSQAIAVTVTNAPVIVLPPPPEPSPEPSPPPDDGDTDEDLPPIGVNLFSPSKEFSSGIGQGSTPGESQKSDSLMKPHGTDLPMLQLNKGGKGLGSTLSELLDALGNPLGLSNFKSEIQALLSTSSGFLKDLDDARDALNNTMATEKTFVASSIAVSSGLSIGYVIWLLRSGVLLTALLSSVPAWQFVNPLLVLGSPAKKKGKKGPEDLEDDSLESMFEQQPHTTETSEKSRPVTSKPRPFRWFRRTPR
ncbi:MAG: Ig-like domain-containing protein [Nitrospirota bacterium]|nr:Ig-like domain-containing protein [Nitrospirota bacterium]